MLHPVRFDSVHSKCNSLLTTHPCFATTTSRLFSIYSYCAPEHPTKNIHPQLNRRVILTFSWKDLKEMMRINIQRRIPYFNRCGMLAILIQNKAVCFFLLEDDIW